MSRHFLLDGYNIIKQVPAWADKSLEDGRMALIRWVNQQRPYGSASNVVTIVFDGNVNFYGHCDGGVAKVVFSEGNSADDLIKAKIEDSRAPKKYVIVSNDKDIVLYVRALGASVMTVADFTKGLTTSKNFKTAPGSVGGEKNISLARQADITKELSKIWLKDHGPS